MEIDMKEEEQSLEKFRSLGISSMENEEEEDDVADFDEDDEEQDSETMLGFVGKPENPDFLLRQYFPSKAGGTPAWMDPVDLPSEKSRTCGICREPLQFLLQVYAPIDNESSTFHRALFVFMCPSMTCLLQDQHEQWKRRPQVQSRSVKVFRCQLPRSNTFYSSEPPKKDKVTKPSRTGAALCYWCGTWKGDKICSGCRSARYCCEKHQALHWRTGHKTVCQRMSVASQSSDSSTSNGRTTSTEISEAVASNMLWPEFEIIVEKESESDTEASEDNYPNSLVAKDQTDESLNSVMDSFEGDDDKRSWASFQVQIGKAPEQVLRYSRAAKAKPLWPMSSGRPSKEDIPNCNYCNGPLSYEMQILPQLLYYFKVKNDVDSLDWASIAIYTCANSCEASVAYKEEFAWVQLCS